MQLRELQDWVMERYLKQVPDRRRRLLSGIRQAVPGAGRSPTAAGARRHPCRGLRRARASNTNAGGQLHRARRGAVRGRGLGTLAKVEDIEEVVIAARGGIRHPHSRHRRRHVGPFPRRGVVTRDGEPSGRDRAHARGETRRPCSAAPARKVEQRATASSPRRRIDTFYDRSQLVRRTLTRPHNLVVGALP